jgi:hypothetical protein
MRQSNGGRKMVTKQTDSVMPQTSSQLMDGSPIREFIMLAGKDGTGKSCAIVSLAFYLQQVKPDATLYVIDTENKFRSAMKSFGTDAPTNIIYYKTDTMNQVTGVVADIISKHRPGDWLAVESMSRVWERAQDLAYNAVVGVSKIEYLERKLGATLPTGEKRTKSPIPSPEDFWKIAKGAHDGAFFDLLTQQEDLNVIITTTIAKPPKDGFRDSMDRKAIRVELGIDANLEGAPRIPYYVETLCVLDVKAGAVSCKILRDNLSSNEEGRIEFDVVGRKMWAMSFWEQCRGGA